MTRSKVHVARSSAPRADQAEPFVTGRGRDAKMPGTGLGLAIARGIVERHGGTIRNDPSAAGGARFVVVLPWVTKGFVGEDR